MTARPKNSFPSCVTPNSPFRGSSPSGGERGSEPHLSRPPSALVTEEGRASSRDSLASVGTEFNGLCELRYRLHKLGDAGVVLSSCSPRGETVVLEALVGFVGVLIVAMMLVVLMMAKLIVIMITLIMVMVMIIMKQY